MTQDNTPPGPIFKAQLLCSEDVYKTDDTFSDSCRRDISNAALFGAVTLVTVEYLSFENCSRECVILCHVRCTNQSLVPPSLCFQGVTSDPEYFQSTHPSPRAGSGSVDGRHFSEDTASQVSNPEVRQRGAGVCLRTASSKIRRGCRRLLRCRAGRVVVPAEQAPELACPESEIGGRSWEIAARLFFIKGAT